MMKFLLLAAVVVGAESPWAGPWVTEGRGIKRLVIDDRPWYRIEFSKEWIDGERLKDFHRVQRELDALYMREIDGEDLVEEIAAKKAELESERRRADELLPDLNDLIPYELDSCAFSLRGTRLDPPDRSLEALKGLKGRFYQAAFVDGPIVDGGEMFANDNRMFAIHDSIANCLEDLSKRDVEAYCVSQCMYQLCDWSAKPFDFETGKCKSRSGAPVECRGSLFEDCKSFTEYVNRNN